MTAADLKKIEKELGIQLPTEFRKVLSARARELGKLGSFLGRQLYQDADRLISINLKERPSHMGTGGAFPKWEKKFVLIGDNGGGNYYCLRLDNTAGVFMIGSDTDSKRPKKLFASLDAYVDEILADHARQHTLLCRSGGPADSVSLFVETEPWGGDAWIVYPGEDSPITLKSLAALGVDLAGINREIIAVLAALLQCPPTGMTVEAEVVAGCDVGLKFNFPETKASSKLGLKISGAPWPEDVPWGYVGISTAGSSAEVIFYNGVKAPARVKFDWNSLSGPLAKLIEAAYPGQVTVAVSPPGKPVRSKHELTYTLPYTIVVSEGASVRAD